MRTSLAGGLITARGSPIRFVRWGDIDSVLVWRLRQTGCRFGTRLGLYRRIYFPSLRLPP